ncbi:uncharacterized protein [Rutidosis leptorrhynchoides]|uniref:uncharacterized protein n=1 Tax=Rutidosis leptorrhynchoides TaxID=125765 RepID=UPI003A990150
MMMAFIVIVIVTVIVIAGGSFLDLVKEGQSITGKKDFKMKPTCNAPNTNQPRRTIIGRVYEKFKPIHEWIRDDDHHILLVYLPGFRKKFLKVTTEDPNILRVRGERLAVGNKWNRFQEDFKIDETCKMNEIRAKFDGGILTISMPKKMINPSITTTPKPHEPMKTSTENVVSPNHNDLQPPMLVSVTKSTDERNTNEEPLVRADEQVAMNVKVKMVAIALVVVVAIGFMFAKLEV